MNETMVVVQTSLLPAKDGVGPLCSVVCRSTSSSATLSFMIDLEYAPAVGDSYDVDIVKSPALGPRIGL